MLLYISAGNINRPPQDNTFLQERKQIQSLEVMQTIDFFKIYFEEKP